uniref:Uncharacterized protein n=1 Tax=viral metagenome TaxID=1070528 RepID=A0A6M3IPG3_9ZZZZ
MAVLIRFRQHAWTQGIMRKSTRCVLCGSLIEPGDAAWRPIDYHGREGIGLRSRLCWKCADQYVALGEAQEIG